jgi:hypothetical protein
VADGKLEFVRVLVGATSAKTERVLSGLDLNGNHSAAVPGGYKNVHVRSVAVSAGSMDALASELVHDVIHACGSCENVSSGHLSESAETPNEKWAELFGI